MAKLITPLEIQEILAEAGFAFKTSCNCGGTYWEKFDNAAGDRVKIAPRKDYFKIHKQPISGKLSELKDKIKEIA